MNYLPFPLLLPQKKIHLRCGSVVSRRCFCACWRITKSQSRRVAPPTLSQWNECSGCCHQLNSFPQSAPRLDRLFSSSERTGRSMTQTKNRCPRFSRRNSRSNKIVNLCYTKSPWLRRSKFPLAGPWISLMLCSWYFPRLPARIRTELDC
jgi:hypothetical protein